MKALSIGRKKLLATFFCFGFLFFFFLPEENYRGEKMSSLNVLNSFWRGRLNIFTVSIQPGMAVRPPYQACATLQRLWLIAFQETMDTESIYSGSKHREQINYCIMGSPLDSKASPGYGQERGVGARWDWSLRLEGTKCFERHSEKNDASEGWPWVAWSRSQGIEDPHFLNSARKTKQVSTCGKLGFMMKFLVLNYWRIKPTLEIDVLERSWHGTSTR